MVWGLFPVDPLPGEHEYYIFRKGTYKVGRKGCDIIVNKDKGVSRVHAEIIVDEMICMDHLPKRHSNSSSKVRIRDCSKYGTFINKNLGSNEKVHDLPNRETMLKDGDIVAFGTGNAKYRFSFISLVFCAPSFEMNQLQDKMSLIGATVTRNWTSKSTHMALDEFVQIDDDIVDAIVARKPLVRFSWIELIAGTTICSEIPSSLLHAPTLILEGASLKVTDPKSREQCLRGYTFLLESIYKYKFKEKLHLLLDLASAEVVYVESQDPCSQNLGDNQVYVMPAGSTSSNRGFTKFNSMRTVKEMELISAVVSGNLDPSVMASAPVLVTSSCSTDETVVADSDVEMGTATSIPASGPSEDECLRKITVHKAECAKYDCVAENVVHIEESTKHDNKESAAAFKTIAHERQEFLPSNRDTLKPDSPYQTASKSDGINITSLRDRNEGNVTRKDKGHASESENLDIIYSQDLIVREPNLPQSGPSSLNGAAINFKRFRKTSAPSGNSFNNLIPFSKYPYEESDYGNEDVAESVKEEKKRKQMEAIADDLFNNEKGRKRGASGSLRELFARG
ncbi:nijmegen breakage syndrome 1 protein isoform X2 [Sesamum indicum]|uniref:Nijmegen breakage syndrome 1 protein isoform X2 n=1 Tax=Sesamum indicum TaxID=4182 RepID=A0A6I9UEZ6_SESIN|nr:nijmegen breakage syndrome 1 protein isoform X2 [Sesamum indicum]